MSEPTTRRPADREPDRAAWYLRLGALGDRETDTDGEKLRHRLLVFMGLLMSSGGLVWGSMASILGMVVPAAIPYGYAVLTALNLVYFRSSKNFEVVRFIQVLISLLLPFLFQWSLGGFGPSGAVMLWAMLALVGSLTFSGPRDALKWLAIYVLLTVISGLLDETMRIEFSPDPSEAVRTLFFASNVVVISSIVFGLTIYLLSQREAATAALEEANAKITELNEHLEDEVSKRTQELRAILDNLADGLIAIDAAGRITAANPAFSALLFVDTELGGRLASDVLGSELAQLAHDAQASGEVIRAEVPLPGERAGAAVASPIEGTGANEGRTLGVVIIVRDVTLEKQIDRMKTDFIATVSHELRTPLTSVLGFAKLTKNKLEASVFPHIPPGNPKAARAVEQVRGNVDIIVAEGQRLTELINDVLDISKMEAGRMEWKADPLQPRELVERAFATTKGFFTTGPVSLSLEVDDDLPVIRGDFDRLLQVLINLIGNAAKFTDAGSVTVSGRRTAEGVELAVSDTGVGIAETERSAIFQKFKQVGDTLTSKPKGTGLGLPICKQIVAAHDSEIRVESHMGKGSRFYFVIPSEAAKPRAKGLELDALVSRIETQVDLALPDAEGDVLVVDDDANLRELVRQQLTERGYTVRQAADGAEAIQSVRAKRPDLVVLDVMMPDISGFDVAAVLKADPATREIPILILSIVQDKERGYRLGVDKYLTKPTDSEVLASEIQKLLKKARTPKRVLLVEETAGLPAGAALQASLSKRGYDVVGRCRASECLEQARAERPDLILVDAGADGGSELIRAIRLDEALDGIVVVRLVDGEPEQEAIDTASAAREATVRAGLRHGLGEAGAREPGARGVGRASEDDRGPA